MQPKKIKVVFFKNRHYFSKKQFLDDPDIIALYFNRRCFVIPSIAAFRFCRQQKLSIKYALSSEMYRFSKEKNNSSYMNIHAFLLKIKVFMYFCKLYKFWRKEGFDVFVIHNGERTLRQRISVQFCKLLKISILFSENGCLPETMIIDPKGVNFKNHLSRDVNFYKDYTKEAVLPSVIKPRAATKRIGPIKFSSNNPMYDLLPDKNKFVEKEISLPEHYIFVPFQVIGDSQITVNSPWIKTMCDLFVLLENSIKYIPSNMVFVVKEHPSCKVCYKDLHKKNSRIIFANGNSTHDLISSAEAIITINSTVGFESLILNKKVLVLGNAFFALEGITLSAKDRSDFEDKIVDLLSWEPDRDLTKKYISYVINEYLIPVPTAYKDNAEFYKIFKSRIMKYLPS